MLEAVNVSKAYDGRPVIRDFSARFVPGSHTCLMGPSGCGKTTLLRLLMGLEAPDSGQIRIPEGTRPTPTIAFPSDGTGAKRPFAYPSRSISTDRNSPLASVAMQTHSDSP